MEGYSSFDCFSCVTENGVLIESYTYDALNQLKTVTRGNDVYTYDYDNGGNILSVVKGDETIKGYTYGNPEWKDLLTVYNGVPITYDEIGNPIEYYDSKYFEWSEGRKLTTVTDGDYTTYYEYDANGLRTKKTVGIWSTEYLWLDGTLYAEKSGNSYMLFHYDDNGIAYGYTTVNSSNVSTDYYYVHNLQGDVIGILDNAGNEVVSYTYDEWGKLLSMTGDDSIGRNNPLRYRGYYFDEETGFYYCMSRYYDPEIGRWINADGQISGVGGDVKGYNLFAYCFNNPTNFIDDTGNWPSWKKIKKVIKNTVKKVVEMIKQDYKKTKKAVKNSFSFEIEAGMGVGIDVDVCKEVSLTGLVVLNRDKFSVEKGEASLTTEMEFSAGLSLGDVVEWNPSAVYSVETDKIKKGAPFYDNPYADWTIDTSISDDVVISLGASLYCVLGLGFDISFNLNEFIEIITETS